ncbi:BamA/TamA family outer membrane protein [Mucilaginibacter myungsuensis]|uniref:Polymerase n=1 Tax=Mucilaginibacter myungsuensis TaxID=649104 RepID=A0A929L5P2_9SPHI|nr:polymerase [Mucilaginibacter myungsuensis]MBE9664455.1 polymerase [Mucilaginibacter myungsuensis]MDN3601400.1 polymerase [Mucilaginibacter myungsuensis]
MKKILLLAVALLISPALFAQMKFLPKFVRKMLFEQDSGKHSSFFLLPVFGSAPETGLELGGSALYSFYTDSVPSDTRVSNIFGYGTVTAKGQSRVSLSTSYWTPHNTWHFIGSASYIDFPFDFYGIGPDTYKANKDPLEQRRFRMTVQADKRVGKNFYIGLMAGGFDYKYANKKPGGIFDTSPEVQDRSGGAGLLIGPSIDFDSRNNNTYTTKGLFINSYLHFYQGIFGNNSYRGGFYNIEVMQYNPIGKRWMLGFDIQHQLMIGGRSPFYLLPALGSDEMMRGYYNGRYRDRDMLAGQAELRYRISDRFALAGFAGAGTVYQLNIFEPRLKPNAGGGVRYFFDVQKGLTLRADYGIGQRVAGEVRQSGFYFALGESF